MNSEVKEACKVLEKGGVILFPTDTIWGLGCDATNARAVSKIYQIKERPTSKSLIVLVLNTKQLEKYVVDVPDVAYDLIKSIEEPLTIIYRLGKNLAKEVIAGDGSVAIRIPKSQFCLDMLKCFGKPITSTSANLSGASIPISYKKIPEQIVNSVDYIVKSDRDTMGRPKPSTIIKIQDNGDIDIIRN